MFLRLVPKPIDRMSALPSVNFLVNVPVGIPTYDPASLHAPLEAASPLDRESMPAPILHPIDPPPNK